MYVHKHEQITKDHFTMTLFIISQDKQVGQFHLNLARDKAPRFCYIVITWSCIIF